MTNPKHTDTSRRDELEKCFNLGDCAWTVRQAVRGYVARHLALIEALEAENKRLERALKHFQSLSEEQAQDLLRYRAKYMVGTSAALRGTEQ